MSHFQARLWSWSSRNRGKVQRNQIMAKTRRKALPRRITGPAYVEHVIGNPGQPVSAEEEGDRDCRQGEHVGELGQEEEEEPEAGVLGEIAHHQLGLGDRHVEGDPAQLGERSDHEDPEADELRGSRRGNRPRSGLRRFRSMLIVPARITEPITASTSGNSYAMSWPAARSPPSGSTCWPTTIRPSARRSCSSEETARA